MEFLRVFLGKELSFNVLHHCFLGSLLLHLCLTSWFGQWLNTDGQKGIRCMMSIDDASAGARSFEEASKVSRILQQTLEKAERKVNADKSCWPIQQPAMLGFVLLSSHEGVSDKEKS